jgi:hypothetical protein
MTLDLIAIAKQLVGYPMRPSPLTPHLYCPVTLLALAPFHLQQELPSNRSIFSKILSTRSI